MPGIRRRLGPLGLFFFIFSPLVYLALPNFPGLAVLTAFLGLLALTIYGPGHLGSDLARLKRPGILLRPAGLLVALVLLAALSLAGNRLNQLAPRLDLSPGRNWTLSPQTFEVLDRLPLGVTLEAQLEAQNAGLFRIREMLAAYSHRTPNLTVTVELRGQEANPANRLADVTNEYLRLTNAEGYQEILYPPFSEARLTAALARAAKPRPDLLYFLQAESSRSPEDLSPKGISEWAAALATYRLLSQSYLWPAEHPELPAEPVVTALVGARGPLGPTREEALKNYLNRGGRVFLLIDPLTEVLSPDFLKYYGLAMPEGVLWDPHTTMALGQETLIVVNDYPRHASNLSLNQPSLWPVTGVLTSSGRPEANAVVWAVAQSSPHAWLETDLDQVARGQSKFDPQKHLPGPLATGVAVEINTGTERPGRMIILADSDLAGNSFISTLGNRDYLMAATAWLAEDLAWLPSAPQADQTGFTFSRIWLRLVFWLLVVAGPLAATGGWWLYYRRR